MAIQLIFNPTDQDLTSQSKMWGCPDLPDSLPYPVSQYKDEGETYDNPLTFICQIRCEDIAALDPEGLLPHTGMLYFFGEVEYFLGHREYDSPGMGEWSDNDFRVLYSPTTTDLHTHRLVDDEGNPLTRDAERITFAACDDKEAGFKLLGHPFFDEIEEQYPGWRSLLQLDCNDDWNLQFYDCGMLCFLTDDKKVKCYLHSF